MAQYDVTSITQLNGLNLRAGDIVTFAKGQTYTGTINKTFIGSATSPIIFTTRGSGAAPIITSNGSDYLFNLYKCRYLTIDGLNFTDVNMDVNNHSAQANINNSINLDLSTFCTIKNCNFSLTGVGIYMTGGNNIIEKNTFGNLRMVVNTPTNVNSDDDYGANPLVISSADNLITGNIFTECWAYSYDYEFDGGAIELYGPDTNNNRIVYNTAVNCEGFMEIGSGNGGSSVNNIVAYNKIINCNKLVYISNSGQYTISVSNLQFYNNTIIQNVNNFTLEPHLISMATGSSNANIIILKNNIFWLGAGKDVAKVGQFTGAQLVHTNNVYKLKTGSVLNFTAGVSEKVTTEQVFKRIALVGTDISETTDPQQWDLNIETTPALQAGTPLGLFTKDFQGVDISLSRPNAGIYETLGSITNDPTTSTTTSTTSTTTTTTTTVYIPNGSKVTVIGTLLTIKAPNNTTAIIYDSKGRRISKISLQANTVKILSIKQLQRGNYTIVINDIIYYFQR